MAIKLLEKLVIFIVPNSFIDTLFVLHLYPNNLTAMLLTIFTYNRPDYLDNLLKSIAKYSICDEVIIFCDELNYIESSYKTVYSDRKGIHYAKNLALEYFYESNHDIMFMVEDDVFFIKLGWEQLYLKDQRDMISYFNSAWGGRNQDGNPFNSQGAFTKITKKVIKKIGYFDIETMGFRGIGHLDYSLRYAREFNQSNYYDVKHSNNYISMIIEDYRHALPYDEVMKHRQNQAKKIGVAMNRTNNFIPLPR